MPDWLYGEGKADTVTLMSNATQAEEESFQDIQWWKVAHNGIVIIRTSTITAVFGPEEWKRFVIQHKS